MKKIILHCSLMIMGISVFSQDGTFFHDLTGRPYMLIKYAKVVDGTPFLKEEFLRGSIILNSGQEIKNQQLRINLLDNQLNYLNEQKEEMTAISTVKEVILFDSLAGRNYFFIHSDFLKEKNKIDRGWYEKLYLGKTSLLKQYKKELTEVPLYGSATVELTVTTLQKYFIFYSGEWKQVKKIKNIAEILTDKKEELLKYIKDHKLTADTEENFIALLDYYNELK